MYFINNIFLFPFSGGCTGATYLYFWEPPQKLPAGCAPRRITQHVHQTFVLFPNIDSSLPVIEYGTVSTGSAGSVNVNFEKAHNESPKSLVLGVSRSGTNINATYANLTSEGFTIIGWNGANKLETTVSWIAIW